MYLILYKTAQDFDNILLFFALRSLKCHYIMEYVVILKEDKTPTSIGGELRQFSFDGSPGREETWQKYNTSIRIHMSLRMEQ